MKRILIALALLAAVQVADAQVKSPAAASKAVASAEAASNDAKKAAKDIIDGCTFDNNLPCFAEKEVFALSSDFV